MRDGSEVQERNFENINELVNNIIGKIKEYKQKGFESVAVICKSIVEAETIGDYIKRKMYIKTAMLGRRKHRTRDKFAICNHNAYIGIKYFYFNWMDPDFQSTIQDANSTE